jgi:lysophospholipase L1-like esterase
MDRLLPAVMITILAMCAGTATAHPARINASSAACGQLGPLPANCGNIVFDGDSISVGVGATEGRRLDNQFMRELHVLARLTNVAAGGRPVSDCLRLFAADVAPLSVPGARFNLIVFHAGDNDIAQGRDAPQTYDAFTRYVAEAHAQGWKVIVSTELQRLNFPSVMQSRLTDYNRRLVANSAGADAVVNLASDPRMTDPAARNDPALFMPDRLHPRDGGYAIMAHMLAAAARRVLPQ